jgi:hypothetical protein
VAAQFNVTSTRVWHLCRQAGVSRPDMACGEQLDRDLETYRKHQAGAAAMREPASAEGIPVNAARPRSWQYDLRRAPSLSRASLCVCQPAAG